MEKAKTTTREEAGKEEVDYEDKLNRCAWKLQGVSGMLFAHSRGDGVDLDGNHVAGICFILDQIAEEILLNTGKLLGVTA